MVSSNAYRRRPVSRGGDPSPPPRPSPDTELATLHDPSNCEIGSPKEHPGGTAFASKAWKSFLLLQFAVLVQITVIVVIVKLLNKSSQGHGDQLSERIGRLLNESPPLAKNYQYIHDDPDHPWHWTREAPPDPALSQKSDCGGKSYSSLYDHFHEHGYAIFTSCSLKRNEASVLAPARDFTKTIGSRRVTNANDPAVRRLALDEDLLGFMEFLHGGRRVFPFQTLNFPKGTQQPLHSDLVHFDTMPRTLMTAAWTAFEDMSEDNGPLKFYPGSHLLGTNDFDELGLRQKRKQGGGDQSEYNTFYGEELEKYLLAAGLKSKIASDMKYGQTFIWAAGLVHGGSKQNDMSLSRLSQVTHYFFEGSDYYWTPRLSNTLTGAIDYKDLGFESCKMSKFAPGGLRSCADGYIRQWAKRSEL